MEAPLCIDLHCHPSIKPFGKAESINNQNSGNPKEKNSIWYYDPPNWWDKLLNWSLTLTKFSQSDFTALHKGNVRIALCALNPIEKGFFTSRPGKSGFANFIYNKVTGIGKDKIRRIQNNMDDNSEFRREYDFYRQLDGKEVTIDGKILCYKLTRNYADIEANLEGENVISAVLTIEGAYVFRPCNNRRCEEFEVIPNIMAVKNWEHVPFFVTLSHHFYNEIGGHSGSLHGFLGKLLDQTYGMNTGLTALGERVIRALLDNSNGQKRIYIDMKHMSRSLRIEYYALLEEYNNVPVIVSHGALNGYEKISDFTRPIDEEHGLFFGGDVNFFDDEIIKIAETNGIFGIQLDDRLISSKRIKHLVRVFYPRKTKLRIRSGKVWNNIRRIAELLDEHGYNAWNITAIGTDFDGMVDPPNGFWTAEELPLLYSYLLDHVKKYMETSTCPLVRPENRNADPAEIMKKMFSENAKRFLKTYYK